MKRQAPYNIISLLLLSILFVLCHYPLSGEALTDEKPISLSVKDVQLDKVLRIISQKTGLSFIPDPAISSQLITADLSDVYPQQALRIIAQLYNLGFQELGEPGKFVVTNLSSITIKTSLEYYMAQFAPAKDLVEVLQPFLTVGVGTAIVDQRTNMIIFQDAEERLPELRQIMEKLDRPTRQIYMKSIIAEISLNKARDTGVQWFTKNGPVVAATDFSLKAVPAEIPAEVSLPSVSGLGVGILDMNIDVALNLLTTINDLNLLSSPYLITLDNQQAVIEVGDQIPYKKLNEYGVTSYEFKDATIKLTIQPHINNDSTITIQLEPQANYQQGSTIDGIPLIATRRAKTQVVVEVGKTVVIGGIMQESDVITESQVPLLGAIPILGQLFKSRKVTKQKTELVILLTPEIIDLDYVDMKNPNSSIMTPKIKEILN